MKYLLARGGIRNGDVIFFRGSGVLAWLVRWWTGCPYSHVGLAWRVSGRVLVLESRPAHRGVTIDRPLSKALADGAYWVPLWVDWVHGPEERALCRLGVKYGWCNALLAAFAVRSRGRALDCSEFVGYVLALWADASETPASLSNFFRESPARRLEP